MPAPSSRRSGRSRCSRCSNSLATAFAPVAARRGVELVVVPTRAFVATDPAFLRRILQNLLSNALRYGRRRGPPQRVLLGCRREGELRCASRSRTTARASRPTSRPIIFDEFVRLQPEDDRPREERGLGLGLAIVERIARMLELPVRIASAPGQGSTFSVVVPRVPAVAGRRRRAALPPQARRRSRPSSFVLCIDNEARVREAMATLLGGWGCRVATAASQAEALRRVSRGRPRCPTSCWPTSISTSGRTGSRSSTGLRTAWGRAVPAALVTADRDPTLRVRARAHQVELLHKPVKPAALRALLRMRERAAAASCAVDAPAADHEQARS